jgi:hypothetical protein
MAALGDLILKLGVNTKNFDKGLGASMRKFKSFGANTKRLGKSLTKSLTLPLLAVGASSFKVAAEFEQSMLKVKAVSGATGAEFKALEADALRLGSATRFSASEVSGLQLEFAKLGFTSSEITKVTEATLALAQASDSDLATAAEVAGSTLRAFGLDASETQRVTDVMASSFSSSALDMSLFKDSMKFVAPVAKSAGLSLEETSAMLAALANNGIKGSQAGTALRRIIQELGTGSGTVSEKIAALNESGLNLTSSFDEVGRSASSALLVLGNSIGDVGNLTTQFEGAEGAAAGMAATMDSGAMGGIARMKSAIEGAQIAIGSALAPTISKIVDKIAELAQRFTNLDSSTKDMIITIGGLAAVIGPLLVVLPTMISAIGTALSLIATPVGAIIAIVAALAAAFLYFFDDIKGPMVDFINFFINLYNESMIFRGAVQSVIMHFKNMFAVGKFIFTSLYDIISTIVSRIGENLSAFGEIITGIFTFDAAKISSGWNRLMDNSFGGIGDIINDVAENGAMLGETLVDNFTTAARNTLEGDPVEFVTTEDLDRVKDKIEGLIPDFNFFGGSGSEGGGSPTEPIEEIIEEVETLDEVLSEPPANVFFDALSNSFNKLKQDTVELGRLGDQMGNAFSNTFKEVLDGSRTAQGGLGSFLKTTIDMALAASTGLIIEAMINSGKFTGPAAPFVIPALVTAGIGMVRGLFSAIKVPAMAEGGIVSGNTLVQVGEYAGAASNPEVIAPLDKLRSMLGNSTNGGAVEVHGVIRGRDIFLTNERASREVGNLRGAF